MYNLGMFFLLQLVSVGIRIFASLLRLFGFGGTALPGLWVERYAPWLIGAYARQYATIVLVTGTNGKTTVQLALQQVLRFAGKHVVNNASGSNMLRGIATTILMAGMPPRGSILICEVEEATMPKLTALFSPHIIIMTNLFRDQLDAYGELHTTAQYLKKACLHAPDAIIVWNGDDSLLQTVCNNSSNKKYAFSLGSYASQFAYEGATSTTIQPMVAVKQSRTEGNLVTYTEAIDQSIQETVHFRFEPPGIYNVYNALATYTTARLLQIAPSSIVQGLETVRSPFGRGEQFSLAVSGNTIPIRMFLVKNPAGFSLVWDLLQQGDKPFSLVLALNDRIADGTDVSWIWDIRMQTITSGLLQTLCCTGLRAHDMALRMKYEGIVGTSLLIEPSLQKTLNHIMYHTNPNHPCFVLATYTAMNELRKHIGAHMDITPYQT